MHAKVNQLQTKHPKVSFNLLLGLILEAIRNVLSQYALCISTIINTIE